MFTLLQYSKQKLQFLKKFNFQNSDISDSEYIQLCKFLVENKHCYATHSKDIGNFSVPSPRSMEHEAKLSSQRSCKIPTHYRAKLNNVLDDLQKN